MAAQLCERMHAGSVWQLRDVDDYGDGHAPCIIHQSHNPSKHIIRRFLLLLSDRTPHASVAVCECKPRGSLSSPITMDPFEDFLDDPAGEVPDIDLDIQLDGNDIMDLDCDPDFNNFLRELADEVRTFATIVATVQLPTK